MNARQGKALRKLELAHQIRSECRREDLAPGSPLPSVRELSLKHGLSKRVVNEELQKLEVEGLLRIVPRVGVFVRDTPSQGLLNQAVLILSDGEGQLLPGQRQSGWLNHVTVAALHQVQALGFNAVFLNPDNLSNATVHRLAAERPLGVLVPETTFDHRGTVTYARQLEAQGIPVVFNSGDQRLACFDRVASDAEAGAYHLTNWFLNQGRQGIAMVYPPLKELYWAKQRRHGYEKAMREAGLEPQLIELPPHTPGPVQEILEPEYVTEVAVAIQPFLDSPANVSVILAASDGPVAELEAACRLLGKSPGYNVFLAGYDNYWKDLEACSYPPARPVVTVDRLNEAMGHEMVRLLLNRVQHNSSGGAKLEPQLKNVTPRIIVADRDQAARVVLPADRSHAVLLNAPIHSLQEVTLGA